MLFPLTVLQALPQKNKTLLESLRKLADHGRNYHEYRSKLRNTAPPAVPFLGKDLLAGSDEFLKHSLRSLPYGCHFL